MELFHTFLDRRYSVDQKLLNLSDLRSDEGLSGAGMFQTTTRMGKLFPVLTTILEKRFTTADQKREAFHSIMLNNNNLEDLQLVKTLAHTFPDLKNLDLSNNKFSSTKDLVAWKRQFRQLEHLIVTGNPFTSHEGWDKELLSWYPNLRFLNGQEVRTEAEIAAKLAASTGEVPKFDNPEALQQYFSNAQQAMVNYVSQETNMTAEYSRHCLTTAGWNLQAAAALFNEQRATLPADAFVVPTTI
ncbi:hypothetical protein BDV96DRAFT_488318 [Lophiotrema nucula]|uniref:mRNA export factor MEX67 n=1 Tax=Lophiotrema nucula TaxID=690887 RepID=A0A6A5ZHS0_9PLEO|nr:hypothetical protein BDV96DRAFT_488318 [Lophiotrema nucula]